MNKWKWTVMVAIIIVASYFYPSQQESLVQLRSWVNWKPASLSAWT